MSRLTDKNSIVPRDMMNAEYAKLADLEDIEDELGIDLVTLLNVKTVFWKDQYGIHRSCTCYIDLCFHELVVYECPEDMYDSLGYRLAFEEYGKTWALTKEELENE